MIRPEVTPCCCPDVNVQELINKLGLIDLHYRSDGWPSVALVSKTGQQTPKLIHENEGDERCLNCGDLNNSWLAGFRK